MDRETNLLLSVLLVRSAAIWARVDALSETECRDLWGKLNHKLGKQSLPPQELLLL